MEYHLINNHSMNSDKDVVPDPAKGIIRKCNLSGIVLAGGLSTRMGRDKASLPWGGSDLLHTVLARLQPVCAELIVVSNVPRNIGIPDVKIVQDIYIRCGPLAGMQVGLKASQYPYSFICACDMPYLNTQSVAYMGEVAVGYDAAVPFIDDFFNPLHSVYHQNCLPYIEQLLAHGKYRIFDLYKEIKVRRINEAELRQFDVELKTLGNLNTPEDL